LPKTYISVTFKTWITYPMHLLLRSLFCVCALLLWQTEAHEVLSEHSAATEKDCLDLLASDTFNPSELNAKFVGFAMKRGFWKCAKELSNMANSMRIDVRSVFDMESRTIAKEIKEIKSAIESTLPVSTISPAFQWAQSPTEIFINVKFAHKLDAPATLNVEAETVNITDTHLVLKATDGRKIFNLNVEFLRKVIPAESTWSMASVGRMTITLKKQTGPDNWPRLTKGKKKPNNIHFWWELHEKHAKELEALEDDDEDGSDPVIKPPISSADVHIGNSEDETKQANEEKKVSESSSDDDAASTSSTSDEPAADETVKPKKTKKKKTKKEKKDKTKSPSLDDLVKDIEKAAKEQKKDVDRKAKADKEAINKETEEKIKQLRRDFYKSKDTDATVTPPIPTDLDKLVPEDDKKENPSEGEGAGGDSAVAEAEL